MNPSDRTIYSANSNGTRNFFYNGDIHRLSIEVNIHTHGEMQSMNITGMSLHDAGTMIEWVEGKKREEEKVVSFGFH